MGSALITVITPTLNAERYFEETLVSLRDQTLGSDQIEHLVIDGGSTDNTLKIVESHSPNSKIVSYKGSIYEAMNKGVELATTPIIAWLNADDLFHPTALEDAVTALARDPTADIAVSHYEMFGQGWEMRYRTRADALQMIRDGKMWRWFDVWVNPLAMFYRKQVIETLGGYSNEYKIVGDWDLWFRAAAHTPALRLTHTGKSAGRFRVHSNSLSSGDRMDRLFVEKKRMMKYWMTNPIAPQGVQVSARRGFRHDTIGLAAWNLRSLSAKDAIVYCKKTAEELKEVGPFAWRDALLGLPLGIHDVLRPMPVVGTVVGKLWSWTGGPERFP